MFASNAFIFVLCVSWNTRLEEYCPIFVAIIPIHRVITVFVIIDKKTGNIDDVSLLYFCRLILYIVTL
jgi:hypothetical protein